MLQCNIENKRFSPIQYDISKGYYTATMSLYSTEDFVQILRLNSSSLTAWFVNIHSITNSIYFTSNHNKDTSPTMPHLSPNMNRNSIIYNDSNNKYYTSSKTVALTLKLFLSGLCHRWVFEFTLQRGVGKVLVEKCNMYRCRTPRKCAWNWCLQR